MTVRRAVLALFLATAGGCDAVTPFASGGACSEDLRMMRSDPDHAAQRSVASGDTRVLMVRGYTTWAPGVGDIELQGRLGTRILERTSDTPQDKSCEQYQDAAIAYAERYNSRIVALAARTVR
jgi:hypothetical protein